MAEHTVLEKAPPKMSHLEWRETEDSREWDDFVVQNGGSIFHTWSWRKVLESDNPRPLYLACRDVEGRILAACPFFFDRAGRHSLSLDSLLDSNVAGPIISGQTTNTTHILASLPKSLKFSPFNPVVAMLIRTVKQEIIEPMIALGFQYEVKNELFIVDMREKTPQHIWNNGFQKHDRQAVKYYEQRGSVFGFAETEGDYGDYLALERPDYRVYEARLRYADLLAKLRLNMGDQLKVAKVSLEDKTIAGFSVLCDRRNSVVHLKLQGALRYSPLKNIHSPVTFLNWKVVNWAHEHGYRYVDLGRYPVASSSDPAHPFHKLKERFEVTLVPTYRFTLPISGTSLPVARTVNRVFRGVEDLAPNVLTRMHQGPELKLPGKHRPMQAS